MKDKINPIDNYVFKPLLIREDGEERFVLSFGCSTQIQQNISSSGKKVKKVINVLQIFDITRTLEFQQPILETCIVSSFNKFRDSVTILEPRDRMSEIVAAASIMINEVSALNQRLSEFGNALTGIRYISSEASGPATTEDHGGNIVFAANNAPLAHIVFNTVTGAEGRLAREDVERIGRVLMEIIQRHNHEDWKDPEALRKLKAEIEYKIVEALPASLKAGDININMEAIVNEIRKSQDEHEGPDDIDDEEDDDDGPDSEED